MQTGEVLIPSGLQQSEEEWEEHVMNGRYVLIEPISSDETYEWMEDFVAESLPQKMRMLQPFYRKH